MTGETKQPLQTILVVEDEVFIRMVISEYLRGCGYKVIEAANADEALTILQHLEIDLDVVFSDVDMPGSMNGFELAKWLSAHRANVDVILTGNVPRAAGKKKSLAYAEYSLARHPTYFHFGTDSARHSERCDQHLRINRTPSFIERQI